MGVFVLIFNVGTENEGIHTVRIGDPTKGVSRNKILMFESEDDATRFTLMLEAQDFPVPTVEVMDAEEIKAFCESAGYDWEIVPANGALIMPPEVNVEETDWQPESNTRDTDDFLVEEEVPNSDLDRIRRQLEGLL
ncbi:DUF3110 domain-containing protein [Cronbergia sp. UHCC 0137]|uniref:DUF3110 domain-containing protein n=1 Tax=Cronbergia sp. UHCC 0137 TaxID=3110239 RepID=UPI002B2052D1|nr:DUF3110 domain-containing protein [Cronbergia sp. UHCC 0137]MEA5618009.1 DUF3110 domain-containing protein [Cronbergia sp. UHCC 0137]